MHALQSLMNRTFTLGQCLAWLAAVLVLATLGAHFYRASEYGLALSVFGVILLSGSRSGWKPYAVAFFLFWGVIEWGQSAYGLAQMRASFGMPWVRAAAILLGVAAVTGVTAIFCLMRAEKVNEADTDSPARLQALVFIGVFAALFYMRQSLSLQFLLLERYLPLLGSVQIFLAAWYAAFAVGQLSDARRSRKNRKRLWLIFGCVFFVQFFLGLLGLQGMLLTGKLHVPIPAFIIFAPIFRESFSMMPMIVLVAVLLTGSAWCSLLCYFGPLDALASRSGAARPLPAWLVRAQTYGRAVILIVGSLAAITLRAAGLSTAGAVAVAVTFGLASLLIMALVSRKYSLMSHCTTFCPMGLVVNILGRVALWRIRVEPGRCDNCLACEAVCKYSAITEESRTAGKTLLRCSLCRDCIGVCKQKAIALHCPGLSPKRAHSLFIGLAAGLHAVFLSVAMV